MKENHNGWQVKSLGEVVRISKGKKLNSLVDSKTPTSKRFIQIDDLRNSDDLKYTEDKSGVLVNEKDVLIAWDGANAGTVGFGLDGFIGSTIARLEILNDSVSTNYFGWYLRTKSKYLRNNSTGATIPHINKSVLESLKILLPPLPIQKQIAEILEKADQAKQKRKEANKLTDEFLQSVFIEMFGDPVKNSKRWEVYSFDRLVEKFQYGTSVKSSLDGIPVLRIPNIIQGVVDLSDLKNVKLSEKEIKSLTLNIGDILFVRTNGNPDFVGRCALFNLENEFVFASYLIRAVVRKENVNSGFLVYLLGNSNYRNVIRSKCSTTAGQFNINTKGLGSLPIIIPPITLQQQFADIVNKTESLKEKQKQSEQELENLFQSLMQRAFKGELVS